MMQTKTLEIAVGLFVAAGLAALFVLAMKVSNLTAFTDDTGYQLVAKFENIGSLKVGAPVSIAGVRVGRVGSIGIDHTTHEAVVKLNINKEYTDIPADTGASVLTAGLLGEQYIALEPGGDVKALKAGDEIKLTQPALILEKIIGQFLFSKAQEGPTKQ
ncbi:MAG: outer membrane lipid asymmetry maintenance protein MlaD [Proteobacteria bacterium]|nr:outer membrane lipid asymmetry maintenance protein MlaD [Pseudomonadota bacterium]